MSIDGRGTTTDRTTTRSGPSAGRRLAKLVLWLLVIAAWVAVCVTWLFPWLTEIGLDPTLGG